jgi:hypothetical protein
MASNINTTTIDTTYPIAGQDNDSQGFRDNFSNTNTNFVSAKAELENIQDQAIFKSALTGSTLNNSMNGAVLSGANLVDSRETVVIHPTGENPVKVSIKAGSFHSIAPSTSITLAFGDGTVTDWPPSGEYSKVRVEVVVNSTSNTITLPSEVSEGAVLGQDGQIITVNAVGRYVYEFSTRDGGVSVSITAISSPQFIPALRTVATSKGEPGDLAGYSGFGFDDDVPTNAYVYVCLQDYTDGVADIWYRTAILNNSWY